MPFNELVGNHHREMSPSSPLKAAARTAKSSLERDTSRRAQTSLPVVSTCWERSGICPSSLSTDRRTAGASGTWGRAGGQCLQEGFQLLLLRLVDLSAKMRQLDYSLRSAAQVSRACPLFCKEGQADLPCVTGRHRLWAVVLTLLGPWAALGPACWDQASCMPKSGPTGQDQALSHSVCPG